MHPLRGGSATLVRASLVAPLYWLLSSSAPSLGTRSALWQERGVDGESSQHRLRLGAWGAELGETSSELAAELAGEPGMTALDSRLLADLLASATSERVALSWSGPESAVVVREVAEAPGGADAADADLWLVMPLHEPQLLRRQAAVP
jgi:hypothetical protein